MTDDSNSISSSTTSSPRSFHSDQQLEETGEGFKDIELQEEEEGEGKEKGEITGIQSESERDGEIQGENISSSSISLGDELQSSSSQDKSENESKGDGMLREGKEEGDFANNRSISGVEVAGKEKDSEIIPNGLTTSSSSSPIQNLQEVQVKYFESKEIGKVKQEISSPSTPSTPNLDLHSQDNKSINSNVSSASNPVNNSPSALDRSPIAKSKKENGGGKGGVSELMKKFQSKEIEKNSPTNSPKSNGFPQEAKKFKSNIPFKEESNSKNVSNSKETQEKEKKKEEIKPDSTGDSSLDLTPFQTSGSNQEVNILDPPTASSNKEEISKPSTLSSEIITSTSPSSNHYSSSQHNRHESESLLNSSIPWATEISNSSSKKTNQDSMISGDEPNRFSGSISGSTPTRHSSTTSTSMTSLENDETIKRDGMLDRNSTRFSTVSLSSNKIPLDDSSSSPFNTTTTSFNPNSQEKRNTITNNSNRNSNSNYDFLLARLENENGRLSRDPKANRSSIEGIDKLKNDFNKLKKEKERLSGSVSVSGSGSGNDLKGSHSSEISQDFETGNNENGGSNLKREISNLSNESAILSSNSIQTLSESDKNINSNSNINNINNSTKENEDDSIDWDFWGSVMNNYQLIAQTRPSELSLAIQAGIPSALRGMMWQLMSSSKDEEMEIIYAYYLKQSSTYEKSIRKDLSRTFPEQEFFKDGKGIGQENLFNVIKAYSLYDEEVGYCQGMQFIVGPLLLNMPDEEAFSTLVRLMKSYDLRGHFTPNMPSLQLRLFQFDCLIEEFLPLLNKHLVRNGIKSSMYASQWFMTLFSYRFPLELVYRVLDSVFAEGIEAIFRFALALMKKSEEILLTLNFEQAVEFLKMNLFDIYLKPESEFNTTMTRSTSASSNSSNRPTPTSTPKKQYNTNQFVKDAFSIQITPYQLDSFAAEFDQKVKAANAHRREVDALRLVNKNLSKRIRDLETQLQGINDEHVDLMNQVVRSKVENDEIANELVKYKILYAQAMENQ